MWDGLPGQVMSCWFMVLCAGWKGSEQVTGNAGGMGRT